MTEIDVINLALARLSQERIVSLDDENDRTKHVRPMWSTVKDAFLSAHEWHFARKIEAPARLVTEGAGPFRFAYASPEDMVKIISVTVRERFRAFGAAAPSRVQVPYIALGKTIWSDAEEVFLEFTSNHTPIAEYPPEARDALAAALAAELALSILNSTSRAQELFQQYRFTMSLAMANDAKREHVQRLGGHHYSDARTM